ncbi:hypothetical protein CAEBREN_03817 [Caenorhabditis brenneri]|uniref:Uncharacterized protein n=1 Tax=Caenorhabditis brenneri TaxID=135651 RepID=G0NHY7_CAEBE|nr:hypothetical protein CAEBREN_03817 [Caenorhabditis brenneri]
MGVFPEIVEFYDVPNQTEWVKIVLAFDPETKEYKVYKDKKLEHQTTDKKFVAKFVVTDTIKKGQKKLKKKGVSRDQYSISITGSSMSKNVWPTRHPK